jgi:hypothetical protein
MNKENWSSTIKPLNKRVYLNIVNSKINVISQNGCTIKITVSYKKYNSKIWVNKSWNIKVKKLN